MSQTDHQRRARRGWDEVDALGQARMANEIKANAEVWTCLAMPLACRDPLVVGGHEAFFAVELCISSHRLSLTRVRHGRQLGPDDEVAHQVDQRVTRPGGARTEGVRNRE